MSTPINRASHKLKDKYTLLALTSFNAALDSEVMRVRSSGLEQKKATDLKLLTQNSTRNVALFEVLAGKNKKVKKVKIHKKERLFFFI